jgi:hypothetical protein
MRALSPRVKRSGFVAALLAGVLLVSVDEAGAKGMGGMSGHAGLGNGHPYGNSVRSGNSGKKYSADHGKERKAEHKRKHCKSVTCEKKWGGNPPRGTGSNSGTGTTIGTIGQPSSPGSTPGKNPDPVYTSGPSGNTGGNPPPSKTAGGTGGGPSDSHGSGSTSLKDK